MIPERRRTIERIVPGAMKRSLRRLSALFVIGSLLGGCTGNSSQTSILSGSIPPSTAAQSTPSAATFETPATTVDPSTQPSVDLSTQPPFPGDPTLRIGSRTPARATAQGGCGGVFRGTEQVAFDDCGPFAFDGVIKARALRVRPGTNLTFLAPSGATFSVTQMGGSIGWSVVVASSRKLVGLEAVSGAGIPANLSRILAKGLGPDRSLAVEAPSQPGDYLVQLASPMARDQWTFYGLFYYWRLIVA